jgi:predicted membrane protein
LDITSSRSYGPIIAAIFMTLLVAWDTAEFALQPVRRPPQTEILVLLTTCAVLAFIPFIRLRARWVRILMVVSTDRRNTLS